MALVTVSQAALLEIVQPHEEDDVDKAVVPEPPLALTDAELAPSEYVQPDACVTLNVTPAIVSVPLRAGPMFVPYE